MMSALNKLFYIGYVLCINNKLFSFVRKIVKAIIPGFIIDVFKKYRVSKNEKKYLEVVKRNLMISNYDSDNLVKNILVNEYLKDYLELGVRPGIDKIEAISYKELEVDEWLDLYFLFFVNGLLQESAFIRYKAVERIVNNLDKGMVEDLDLYRTIGALNEIGYRDEDIKSKYRNSNPEITKYIDCKEEVGFDFIFKDSCFSSMVENKNILILGPASYMETKEDRLDEFDLVITTNEYLLDPNIYDLAKEGKVISYYNSYNEKLMHINRHSKPYEFVYSVYRGFKYDYQFYQGVKRNCRIIHENNRYFNGVPQALQAIIYDLKRYSVSSVKISGFDLYTSKVPYKSTYKTARHRILYDLARHDLISNFLYMKSEFDNNTFESDDVITGVLRLSLNEYLNLVEKSMSSWKM